MSANGEQRHQGETLQELALRRLQELGGATGPLSAYQASQPAAGYISYELLRRILRGQHGGGISDRVAEGLSIALQVPISKVYEAAGQLTPGEPWPWPERFARLPGPQRKIIEDLVGAMLEMYDQGRKDATRSRDAE